MTRFIDTKKNWSKIVTIALTGASLSAPSFMAAGVQADSFELAPGYSQVQFGSGYRDRNRDGFDDRDIDRDGDIDRDIDRDGDIDFNDVMAGQTSIIGRVTQDLDGDRFVIRAENGQTYIVNLRGQSPVSIREGSRVRVTGTRNGNRITRATVQVLGNGYGNGYGNDYGRTTTIVGRVIEDLDGDRFRIRAENGQTFIVNLRGNGPASLQEGSRVRVTGLRNGNRITRASVQVLGNGNGYGNRNRDRYRNDRYNDRYNDDDNANTVEFRGVVRSADVRGPGNAGIVVVEADNGRVWRVQVNDATSFPRGTRLRVRGTVRNNTIINNQVDPA